MIKAVKTMSGPSPYPWQAEQWARLGSQLAQQRLAHAYLLCGERGLGKKEFALATARLLLCSNPGASGPCDKCRDCGLSNAANHPDLLYVAPDEGSHVLKVDQVRSLAGFAQKTSHSASRKVIIVEKSDALNRSAANALLKTLEEPPGDTVLLLLSDNPGKLIATIRSRCQRILFVTPDSSTAETWLAEQTPVIDQPETLLAAAAGKPLLALQLLESGELKQRADTLQALAQITAGKLDPLVFAAAGKTMEATTIVDCIRQTSATLAKQLLSNNDHLLASPEVRAIANTLKGSNKAEADLVKVLLQLNRAAEEARRQLNGVSNPNRQLIIESMLWRWARATA